MRIRSFTVGVPLFSQMAPAFVEPLKNFSIVAKQRCKAAGVAPPQLRLTLPPMLVDEKQPILGLVDRVSALACAVGADCYCLPLDLVSQSCPVSSLDGVLHMLLHDPRLFINLIVADKNAIGVHNVNVASRFILDVAQHSGDRGDNFRVGASAACEANTPYFPFSRHQGDVLAFSIAAVPTPDALELALQARRKGWALETFHTRLIELLIEQMQQIDELGNTIAADTGMSYRGLDSSFAPVPSGGPSVAELVQAIGPTPAGAPGSVFVTSVLTDALKVAALRAHVRTVGFNGVMYALTEDHGLAAANDAGALTLAKFALLSAVCGCGIDMVPVPGTTQVTDISGVILDVATLAVRLHKPLGVRLLPTMGGLAGDMTQLKVDMLSQTKVVGVGASEAKPMFEAGVWRYAGAQPPTKPPPPSQPSG